MVICNSLEKKERIYGWKRKAKNSVFMFVGLLMLMGPLFGCARIQKLEQRMDEQTPELLLCKKQIKTLEESIKALSYGADSFRLDVDAYKAKVRQVENRVEELENTLTDKIYLNLLLNEQESLKDRLSKIKEMIKKIKGQSLEIEQNRSNNETVK